MMLASDRTAIQNGLERGMRGGIIMARGCNAGQKASTPDMLETDSRLALLQDWLSRDLGLHPQRIEPASSDASFRRYFRAFCDATTFVVMDAPPGKEDVRPYLKVTQLLRSEEHTSELQSQSNLVCRLLLEKK